MTFQEAVNSGKRIRRSGQSVFTKPSLALITIEDVLASDWEIDNNPITKEIILKTSSRNGTSKQEIVHIYNSKVLETDNIMYKFEFDIEDEYVGVKTEEGYNILELNSFDQLNHMILILNELSESITDRTGKIVTARVNDKT